MDKKNFKRTQYAHNSLSAKFLSGIFKPISVQNKPNLICKIRENLPSRSFSEGGSVNKKNFPCSSVSSVVNSLECGVPCDVFCHPLASFCRHRGAIRRLFVSFGRRPVALCRPSKPDFQPKNAVFTFFQP
jgi:hypothetical protein